MVDAVQFILAGMLVGFCVGITGVGGGSLMTPMLISLFKIEPHIAIGTDLIYASISKFCGSIVHAKKLNVVWPIVSWLALGSVPASFATHWVLEHYLSHSSEYKAVLTMVLGFMLTLTGISIIFRSKIEKFFNHFRKKEVQSEELIFTGKRRIYVVFMGIVLGVFVTLSSVGAGAFGVMALILLFPNLPMIRIIGSDVAHAVLLTFVAGIAHMSSGNVDFHLLGWLLIGSIPAIIFGTLISSKLPEKMIRKILGITLFLLGINFILHPVKEKPKAKAETAMLVQPVSSSQQHV
ncbi:sulfite exporter TauE/SafE family protein [Acinetobacter sp. ANC 4633]|uniref:sulfite exporter TauE/SafE family protein n=1 Tax=Acinetobacter sp. ANC 4633 TaxID=2529845 RepID=UPI001038E362|nr:sulfite exporter TauE/SafE family protein [Acinetobacter sp. ANC 4633]TCB27782.1 sulfite exporter TauE/SafE family protein [Acinetobacter sp. ANC 4633]